MTALVALVLGVWTVVGVLGARALLHLYAERGRELSPRTGIPRGIRRPRPHLEFYHTRTPPGLHVHARRMPRPDAFGPAFVESWVSWELMLIGFTHCVAWRWWTVRRTDEVT